MWHGVVSSGNAAHNSKPWRLRPHPRIGLWRDLHSRTLSRGRDCPHSLVEHFRFRDAGKLQDHICSHDFAWPAWASLVFGVPVWARTTSPRRGIHRRRRCRKVRTQAVNDATVRCWHRCSSGWSGQWPAPVTCPTRRDQVRRHRTEAFEWARLSGSPPSTG